MATIAAPAAGTNRRAIAYSAATHSNAIRNNGTRVVVDACGPIKKAAACT